MKCTFPPRLRIISHQSHAEFVIDHNNVRAGCEAQSFESDRGIISSASLRLLFHTLVKSIPGREIGPNVQGSLVQPPFSSVLLTRPLRRCRQLHFAHGNCGTADGDGDIAGVLENSPSQVSVRCQTDSSLVFCARTFTQRGLFAGMEERIGNNARRQVSVGLPTISPTPPRNRRMARTP